MTSIRFGLATALAVFAAIPASAAVTQLAPKGGLMEGGFEKMAPAVDGVLGEQVGG